MTEVKQGDRVQIHYTGRLEDGTVFDTSQDKAPLEFTAGSPEVIPGVSEAVIGMKPGDTKTVTIEPAQAFGERIENQAQRVERQYLPEDVQVGSALQAQSEESEEPLTVWVVEMDEESAVLDLNHPLAGKGLIFDIELIEAG